MTTDIHGHFIEDTSTRDPLIHMVGMLGGGSGSAYIEGMEAAGQRQLVNSTTLPTDLGYGDTTIADYEALGFKFGDVVAGDPMFQEATLPEGWERQGSDHAMWSYIVDERGIERVGIFYKAAFYDRSAHMSISRPGYSLGSKFVYGCKADQDDVDVPWDLLTEDERSDFIESLKRHLDSVARHPTIYDDEAQNAGVAARLVELGVEYTPDPDRG